MALETIAGELRAYRRLQKGTFQHVDQLQAERQIKSGLRDLWFYTADGNGYFVEGKNVAWAITREADNLVLRHLEDSVDSSYNQLDQNGNYRPDNAEAAAARAAKDTVVIDMGKLRLSGDEKVSRYLQIRTEDGFVHTESGYKAPNEEEQKAMTRLGFTPETLKMLRDSDQKIGETHAYVLNPDYVRKNVDNEHNSLWRASYLNDFDGNSKFDADMRDIATEIPLRGVPLVAPEGRRAAPTE